jgi:2-methylcitrate dehydratase PrpD
MGDASVLVEVSGSRFELVRKLVNWVYSTTLEALHPSVIRSTEIRVLDVAGLAVLGAVTGIGQSARKAALLQHPDLASLGKGDATDVAAAAFTSSPAVGAGLALCGMVPVSGST